MTLKNKRASKWFFLILPLMAAIATIFQNCSNQDFTNTLSSNSDVSVSAANADSIPFAFDFKPNELAYMSCSRSGDRGANNLSSSATHLNNPDVFFTFKVGSYGSSNSGLSLRPEFINYVNTHFSKNGVLSDTEIQNALTNGTAHSGAALQLAIRDSTPIAEQIQFIENNGPTDGVSFNLFPQSMLLTSKEFLPQLINLFKNPSVRLSSLGTSTLQSYPLQGVIHEENNDGYNELTAEEYRRKLQSSSSTLSTLLSITFSPDLINNNNPTNVYRARTSNSLTSDNRVWGTGFKMVFTSDARMRWKQNIIGTVQEFDLSTFEPTTSKWTCPAWFRYIIVSPVDRNSVYPCYDVANEAALNSVQRDDLAKVRRVLSPAEWIIDPIRQCVSPRRANLDCYGNRAFNTVDYSGTGTQCGLDANNYYLHKDCAEFVSFCFRQ